MLRFLMRGRNWPIALDLGSDSIKMLQMKRVGSLVRVAACGRWQYPDTAGEDVAHRDEMAVLAVREMLRHGGFTGHGVISALSSDELTIKNLRLPHMAEEALDKAVRYEARERFGLDVAGDELGFLNAGQVRQGAETRDEIIVLATTRDKIERHLRLLREMDLSPQHIDAEPVALFRSFERFLRRRSDEQAVSVAIDIGRRATRVIVARGRQIVFIKSLDIGGRKLTEAVAKQLNISVPEAKELRQRVVLAALQGAPAADPAAATGPGAPRAAAPEGGADRGAVGWTVRDAIRGEMEALSREVSLCLRYCAVTFRGLRPERALLTGGEAYDPAVVELLSEHLAMPCLLGQPLKGIDLSDVDLGSDRRATCAEWAVCAGLAGRHADIPSAAPETQEAEDGNHRISA